DDAGVRADQGGSGAGAQQSHPGPDVGVDLDVLGPVGDAAPVGLHLAALAHGVGPPGQVDLAGEGLGPGDLEQVVGVGPRLGVGVLDDEVDAQAEAQGAAVAGGLGAQPVDLLLELGRGLSPGQVDVDEFGGQVQAGFGGAAEPQGDVRPLHRFQAEPAAGAGDVDV